MRVIIVGGGTAGSNLAMELRKLDKEIEIIVLEKSNYLEYSHCSLPYVLSREIKSFEDIFLVDEKFYSENRIDFRRNAKVFDIDRKNKKVFYKEKGEEKKLNYDKLVLCTGGSPFVPKIKNLKNVEYFTFGNIDDAKRVNENVEIGKKAIVVGGGQIGVEVAYSLRKRGMEVLIVEAKDRLIPASFDNDTAKILEKYLEDKNIKIRKNSCVEEATDRELKIGKETEKFDLLIISAGFVPNLELAKKAEINYDKGILVDEHMRTSDEDIFACGDCVEVKHFLTDKNTMSQLGSSALREAEVIARNLAGIEDKFVPVLNNSISKIGDLYYGSTGINKEFADKIGLTFVSGKYKTKTKPIGGKEITIKLLCSFDGRILGAQIISYENPAARLDLITNCIKKGINVRDLIHGEYCYNPCVSNAVNELNIVAGICKKKLELKKNYG